MGTPCKPGSIGLIGRFTFVDVLAAARLVDDSLAESDIMNRLTPLVVLVVSSFLPTELQHSHQSSIARSYCRAVFCLYSSSVLF